MNTNDVLAVRNQIDTGTYLIWTDVDGSGSVDLTDYMNVRKRIGTHLP